MTASKSVNRCAIYTRKSSEEGLDQAFNSLHAQREACEAYVLSQAGEGWKAMPTLYDDGGFSGGTIERPALQRLLVDITAGRIDTIVVYKIDRLTRSLGDFAKIVDRLDAAGASFVSVTQAFNTTTSMGRLTLNVLLSFAQFEREVTGERIRDKLAASKAKGMWMGGNLALGYDRPTDPITRALVINPAEADTVRLIFSRYLELQSVSELERWLASEGVRSKAYVSSRGRQIGGAQLSRGAIFHLLKNGLYLGEIPHKDRTYPGAHLPIIDPETFAKAQGLLARNASAHRERSTRVGTAPLKGIIFDTDGHPMCPTFARGRGEQPYRYYVSSPLQQGRKLPKDDDAIRRVPANAVETVVFDRLTRIARLDAGLADWTAAKALLRRVELHPSSIHLILDLGSKWTVDEAADRLRRKLQPKEHLLVEGGESPTARIVLPVRMSVRGGRTWLTTPDGRDAVARAQVDRTLVKALRAAHAFAAQIGHYGEPGCQTIAPARAYDRKRCLLAFLAPDIQQAILEGRQPAHLNLETLIHGDLPMAWSDQRAALGFFIG